ncbi:hypothetical protein [Roseofilum sp. Belize Diploria]|uniref:hypothetical protein n=1 Tax=Roseofilum sp. Belize Diploria TaxID=2821501 RepID=UPI001B04FF61|nr:hypothetical protein [Roseofilum sp. Belize Diploria]MBP0010726.1 hypothetical protein [Roseofilum sp. Belize Diploria]
MEVFSVDNKVSVFDANDCYLGSGEIISLTLDGRVLVRDSGQCSILESWVPFITKEYDTEETITQYRTGVAQMKIAYNVGDEFTMELTELIERIIFRCVKEINELRTRKAAYQNQSELSNFTYEQSIAIIYTRLYTKTAGRLRWYGKNLYDISLYPGATVNNSLKNSPLFANK